MVTAAQGNGQGVEPKRVRGWFIIGAIVALIVFAAFAAFVSAPSLTTTAGECSEVKGASCRPYLTALYDSLGERANWRIREPFLRPAGKPVAASADISPYARN